MPYWELYTTRRGLSFRPHWWEYKLFSAWCSGDSLALAGFLLRFHGSVLILRFKGSSSRRLELSPAFLFSLLSLLYHSLSSHLLPPLLCPSNLRILSLPKLHVFSQLREITTFLFSMPFWTQACDSPLGNELLESQGSPCSSFSSDHSPGTPIDLMSENYCEIYFVWFSR